VKRVLSRCDSSRPVVSSSGILPHLPASKGTDSHLYPGWYNGHAKDLDRWLRLWPRIGSFVSEFGAQAVPADPDFAGLRDWPNVDWNELAERYCAQVDVIRKRVPPEAHDDLESWVEATQQYQAYVVREVVETLRRLRYHPCGGYIHFSLNDAMPAVSWSVLDHRRIPKAGYFALADASRPVLPIAGPLPSYAAGGGRLRFDIYVVNDSRQDLLDCSLRVGVHAPSYSSTRCFTGSCPADGLARVTRLNVPVPNQQGSVKVELALSVGESEIVNDYSVPIVPA
jgi:beta-mannosidase